MKIPPSEHFSPISLETVFNIDRTELAEPLQPFVEGEVGFGPQVFHGIPFGLGQPDQPNVILLDQAEVRIEVPDIRATYLIFLHVVEDRPAPFPEGLTDFQGDIPGGGENDGNTLGQRVSDYQWVYQDGTTVSTPILRRFAIQQSHLTWGASPFAAVPFQKHGAFRSSTEQQQLGQVPDLSYGWSEARTRSARDRLAEKLWLYALPNPHPDKPIQQIVCTPQTERSLIYAISSTNLPGHPLRPRRRQKLSLALPAGVSLNIIGELDGLEIDLGEVISARAQLEYNHERWSGHPANVQPIQSERQVVVEYSAHPQAKLYLSTGSDQYEVYDLAKLASSPTAQTSAITINPAHRPVRLQVVDKATQQLVAVRLHMHGQFGEYLPPKGYHRRVNAHWFEDNYGEFVNSLNQYCYVWGECMVDLPLGEVYIEISRGYEISPLRTSFIVTPEMDEITFELERVLHWRERGWVTADTHVHFLSPQTALLEGSAEGVNVVNVLASQWGEMFSNVGDFDGKTTIGAKESGGDGEFLVRVGTENRMQVLGHISLLGYNGLMIHPLCSGGPSESALGDAQEVTMAEWAQRCIDQGGLVVMPHAPNPQAERAADIVLGLVNAIEMMTFNPFDAQISPYGLADWYRFLNLGYHLPVVGGSDKMSARDLLGGVRTYAHLGGQPFTYENWMAAIRAGHTFVTVGPLVDMTVEGLSPGSRWHLPAGGGTVTVTWRVESVSLPLDWIEIVVGGLTAAQIAVGQQLSASGSATLTISESTWLAVRVRGSHQPQTNDSQPRNEIAAHTSAVQIVVAEQPLFSKPDAISVLEQIEGAMAYVDTIAPRPDVVRYKQLRLTLERAHNRLHQRLHAQGLHHEHTPLHDHEGHREH